MSCPSAGDVVDVSPGLLDELAGCDLPAGMILRIHYEGAPMPDDEPMPEAAPGAEPHAEPAPHAASVEVSAAPAVDPALIQQVAANDPMLAVILALVAVLGGGAAWKQWGKLSDQRHEQAMRRLELEAEAVKAGAAQPPPCQAANAELTAKLAALEQRVGRAEHGLSVGAGIPDEIEARIAKLERAKRAETTPRRATK